MTTHNVKRIVIAAAIVALLLGVYVMTQLVTANGDTGRSQSLAQVPGGSSVDPDAKLAHERKVTFHTWSDPSTGRRYVLAHGEAKPASLERLAMGSRYTARYGSRYERSRASSRIAGWYETHGVGTGWPSGFSERGCEVYGRTARGTSFRMFFDRGSGKFVMRYELR